MSDVIKCYKGTDKDMRCYGGFQYELGKTVESADAIRCGNLGFHACEAPLDVLRYFNLNQGNRYFVAEAGGKVDRTGANGSKFAASKLTLKAEIGLPGLIEAHAEYTREKAKSGEDGGDYSNLAGGDDSNLAGGDYSNLAGGNDSNLAGGDDSNLAGGNYSNLAGGNRSNLAGGDCSNLAGGNRSNLAGGNRSNLAGGDDSTILARNGSKAKAGLNSVIVLTSWDYVAGMYKPVKVKAEIVDGQRIKADTWYRLVNGAFEEVEE